jgi:hypothetical protein
MQLPGVTRSATLCVSNRFASAQTFDITARMIKLLWLTQTLKTKAKLAFLVFCVVFAVWAIRMREAYLARMKAQNLETVISNGPQNSDQWLS